MSGAEQTTNLMRADKSERIGKKQRCVERQRTKKQCEQTVESIIASINPNASNAAKMESSDSEKYDAASTIELASKPPLKTPMCYSFNQIEILQTLGNYTFAAHFETDEFLQKVIPLIQKPNSTNVNRLPAPWREKFKCLSLDKHN